MKIVLPAMILLGIAWAAIAIKMFLKRNGEFRKSCESQNNSAGKTVSCACGKSSEDNCHNQ
ncbi:MAG TPA: hypothetical protein VLH16_03005 [Bacteroidales bacterium]|nr:hypothetical protein [Bacteroidales bacterium]